MDNPIGAHVALTRLVEADDGRSRFADANLPYDKVLGPLRQSTVIDASAIRFGWWSAAYKGALPSSTQRQVVLVLEGVARIESDGASQAFSPGDVLELTQQSGSALQISSDNDQPGGFHREVQRFQANLI
jgi:hypothetical protein